MQFFLRTVLLSAVTVSSYSLAQDLPTASPESVGLSSAGLAQVTDSLQAHIDAGHIAGVVAAVLREGKLVYLESLGQRDIAAKSPMTDDSIFRTYSMTRPVTSLAAMLLFEEGKFQLDDPISKYLPQFADQRVFTDSRSPDRGQTANGSAISPWLILCGTLPVWAAAARQSIWPRMFDCALLLLNR
jgi:CubicO group peptidase (beta-lactamase class C family)